jgi:hypothetical protein
MQKLNSVHYNTIRPNGLKKVDLDEYANPSHFEMVIADDGSRQDTFDLIENWKEVFYPMHAT